MWRRPQLSERERVGLRVADTPLPRRSKAVSQPAESNLVQLVRLLPTSLRTTHSFGAMDTGSDPGPSTRPNPPTEPLFVPWNRSATPPPAPLGKNWIKAWKGKQRAYYVEGSNYSDFLQGGILWAHHQSAPQSTSYARQLALRRLEVRKRMYATDFSHIRVRPSYEDGTNHLVFSHGAGRLMATTAHGESTYAVHIHDFFSPEAREPAAILGDHCNRVDAIAWSADDNLLFSGDEDGIVTCYDLGSDLQAQARSLECHEGSIRQVSTHPFNPWIIISGCDGGQLKVHDIRSQGCACTWWMKDGNLQESLVGAAFNPSKADGNTFATAGDRGRVRLFDLRSLLLSETHEMRSIVEYQLKPQNRRDLSDEVDSIAFDPTGQHLAVVTSGALTPPVTIFKVGDPEPYLRLSTDFYGPVSGERLGAYDTTSHAAPAGLYLTGLHAKRGSFGLESHTGRLHYAIGSDDFRGYVFDLASPTEPAFVLEGANSIVNNVVIHPTLPLIATAGNESSIRLYTPQERKSRTPPTRVRYRVRNPAAAATRLNEQTSGGDESWYAERIQLSMIDELLRSHDEIIDLESRKMVIPMPGQSTPEDADSSGEDGHSVTGSNGSSEDTLASDDDGDRIESMSLI